MHRASGATTAAMALVVQPQQRRFGRATARKRDLIVAGGELDLLSRAENHAGVRERRVWLCGELWLLDRLAAAFLLDCRVHTYG